LASGAGREDEGAHTNRASCHGDLLAGVKYQSEQRATKIKWAELSKRPFGVEVKRCERCGYVPLEDDACKAERMWRGKALGDEPNETEAARDDV
jgi:hypothetical protein